MDAPWNVVELVRLRHEPGALSLSKRRLVHWGTEVCPGRAGKGAESYSKVLSRAIRKLALNSR